MEFISEFKSWVWTWLTSTKYLGVGWQSEVKTEMHSEMDCGFWRWWLKIVSLTELVLITVEYSDQTLISY